MIRFLLDTNVVSEVAKPKPHQVVADWYEKISDDELAISVMTIRELAYGVEKAKSEENPKAPIYAAGLADIRTGFAGRILPIDDAVATAWAILLAKQWKHVDDKCLVATAKVHGLTLVTRNVAHTSGHGVTILDPFKKQKAP